MRGAGTSDGSVPNGQRPVRQTQGSSTPTLFSTIVTGIVGEGLNCTHSNNLVLELLVVDWINGGYAGYLLQPICRLMMETPQKAIMIFMRM